jgi:hypothetical protein
MIVSGIVENQIEIARIKGVSRSKATHILNLLM